MSTKTLYTRLGGYDGIVAVVSDLLPRLQQDPALSLFWERRPEDSLQRSKQLLIDFPCSDAEIITASQDGGVLACSTVESIGSLTE